MSWQTVIVALGLVAGAVTASALGKEHLASTLAGAVAGFLVPGSLRALPESIKKAGPTIGALLLTLLAGGCGHFDWHAYASSTTRDCVKPAASAVFPSVIGELAAEVAHAVDGRTPIAAWGAPAALATIYGVGAVLCAAGHLLSDLQGVAGHGARCHGPHPASRPYLLHVFKVLHAGS